MESYIVLPISCVDSDMSACSCLSPASNNKILVVDDVPDNLFLMDFILGDENYELTCVDNGAAALSAIDEMPPDLVLLDVMMPGLDGYEVTRRIRQNKNLPYIPILLVTADDNVSEATTREAGADGFIRKPFDIEKMLLQVQQALAASCVCA